MNIAELQWKPLFILNKVSASVGSVIKPAGFENSQDILSAAYAKDPTDPQWKDDKGMKDFDAILLKYVPDANRTDGSMIYGYNSAQTLVHVLKACGDNLVRENVMKQAASIRNLELGGLLCGVKINTSATDFAPISQMQLMKFKGETWVRFGEILNGDVGG